MISPMVCFCCSVPVEPLCYHYHVCILMVTPGWRLEQSPSDIIDSLCRELPLARSLKEYQCT